MRHGPLRNPGAIVLSALTPEATALEFEVVRGDVAERSADAPANAAGFDRSGAGQSPARSRSAPSRDSETAPSANRTKNATTSAIGANCVVAVTVTGIDPTLQRAANTAQCTTSTLSAPTGIENSVPTD